jgi:hypothetical protein
LGWMRGVLSPEAPRAQEGDKRGSPSLPAITSGSEMLGVKVLTSGVAWGLDPAPRQRDGQKEPSWVASGEEDVEEAGAI